MKPDDESFRDRLIAQQGPLPEKLDRYRNEIEALLNQLRRRQWWADTVRAVLTILGAIVLFPLAIFFGLTALYFLAGGSNHAAASLPAAASLVCLASAIALLRWFFRRRDDDLLLEVKRLQAQGLELEEQLQRLAGR